MSDPPWVSLTSVHFNNFKTGIAAEQQTVSMPCGCCFPLAEPAEPWARAERPAGPLVFVSPELQASRTRHADENPVTGQLGRGQAQRESPVN